MKTKKQADLSAPGLWSRKHIAAYLGVSPNVVDNMRRRGEVPPPDFGGPGTCHAPKWRQATIRAWFEGPIRAEG